MILIIDGVVKLLCGVFDCIDDLLCDGLVEISLYDVLCCCVGLVYGCVGVCNLCWFLVECSEMIRCGFFDGRWVVKKLFFGLN